MKNDLPTRLIIGAHPDDIILGMAGRLKIEQDKYNTHILTMCCGREDSKIIDRLHTDHSNLKELNCSINQQTFFDLKLDTIDNIKINKIIENEIRKIKPDEIFVIDEDNHYDHKIIYKAVMTATRSKARHQVKGIFAFELPLMTNKTSSDNIGYEYIDIEEVAEMKFTMLEKYLTERIDTREIEMIQKLWGLQSSNMFHCFEKYRTIYRKL